MTFHTASGGNTPTNDSMATLKYKQNIIQSEDSASGDSGRGQWGEQGEGERVEFEKAITEFKDLKRELSRPATHGAHADEEEGGNARDSNFVDLEEYLTRANREADESGIIPKKIGIRFKNLTVQGSGSGSIFVRTFADELLGLFGKDLFDLVRNLVSRQKPITKNIIQGFSGVVKPGEMLLVLGTPGSGSSTFLRALTNQRRDFTTIKGEVDYSGLGFETARRKFRGEILYNSEEDIHLPTLTVGQTVRFALKTKTPSKRLPGVSRDHFVEQMLELFLKMFGMNHTLNTIVGNQFIRGVSGGERKRVSIMEALASRATVNAFDNSTRGLDSSTAVDYIKSLRILTTLTKSTTIVTLYQAGEQIYREFDKVCLIDAGRQIYYGPASEARAYFEELGFEFTPGTTTSDFLTSVTNPFERRARPDFKGKLPSSSEELEAAFRNSRFWDHVQKELVEYDQGIAGDAEKFTQAVKEDKSKLTRKKNPYTISFMMQVWYLLQRELQVAWQDQTGLRSRFINTIVLGLLAGALAYKIPKSTAGPYIMGGALFFNLVVIGWMQILEAITMTVGRTITAKQVTMAFYRPSAQVIAKTIADLPVLAVQCALYTLVLYFMTDMARDAGKFFLQLLFVFTTSVCITAFYRVVGAFSRDINSTIRMAFLGLNIMAVFSGYMQPLKAMKSWVYKWIFYAVPVTYAQEALMVNQYDGIDIPCATGNLIPGVPGASLENQICFFVGAEPGASSVSGTRFLKEQFGYERAHVWRNYGIILLFTFGYIVIACIGVEYLSWGSGGGSTKVFLKPGWGRSKKSEQTLPTPQNKAAKKPTITDNALQPVLTSKSVIQGRSSIFSWSKLNYVIPYGGGTRQLLTDIHGYVKPGALTALMGPSGAGKTTLLDTLSQKSRIGVVSGEMLVDGKKLKADFQRSTGFVEQMDIHDGSATVREALRFSALLRQPATVSKGDKFKFVEDIIRLLELENLADALIGEPGFGLSVEERKRVTIGVELAAKPETLLFLDEPTSGLDSAGALSIIHFLRKLADESNIAILCTIHQPSAILFGNFDNILLLTSGGGQAYFGPIGQNGKTVIDYFERNGAIKAHIDDNPAEYILETTRASQKNHDWPAIWDKSPESQTLQQEIADIITERGDTPHTRVEADLEYAMPFIEQVKAVTQRVWRNYWRDPNYGYSSIFSNISMSLIAGILFLQSGHTILEMQSRGFAVFLVVILSPLIVTKVQPKFLTLRMLYEARERNSKIYSAPAFITAMIICEIPYAILGTFFFFFPWYYMIGMNPDSNRAGYQFFLILIFQIWIAPFGMWIAAMCPDLTVMSIVNPFLFVITNAFTGVLVPYSQLLTFFRSWVYWANPLTYLVRGLMSNVLHGVEVTCSSQELVRFTPPSGQTCMEYAGDWLKNASGYMNQAANGACEYCVYKNGDEYMKTINIEYYLRWRDLGIFIIFVFSNIALVYINYWAFWEFQWRKFFARKMSRN
ncbi:ABC-2 type transporter-domain-containing protein [Tirmania nivea]|nr:ABC-2 type transporter-domain-containing protein [Tirmania nivea]